MVGRDSWVVVYMLASQVRGTIYIGVTSGFIGRMDQHREGLFEGFTKKYGVTRLVWFHELMTAAIQREKSLKRWPRQWKVNLIEHDNPNWEDLFPQVVGPQSPEDYARWRPPDE